jgi:hypothetical protein
MYPTEKPGKRNTKHEMYVLLQHHTEVREVLSVLRMDVASGSYITSFVSVAIGCLD